MKNNKQNKFKTFRVRYKPKINIFQIIGITALLLTLPVAMLQLNNVLAHFTEYRLSKFIISLPLLTLLAFWFTVFFQSKYSYSKIQRTKAILNSVIEMNKLYFVNPVTKQIDSSMIFYFFFTENKLVIQAYSFGASYTHKADDLGEIFESAFGLNLNEININNAAYVEYELLLQKPKRISITSIDDIKFDIVGEIPLDSWKKWDYVKYPHALVAGMTGSGKTFFLYYLMLQFAKQGAEIYIMDPKRSDLSSLIHYVPKGHTHVLFTPNQITSSLRKINDIMNQRYEKYFMSTKSIGIDYRSIGLHPIIIFFDEVAAFMEEDKKVAKEAEAYLKQISMKARMVGIYLVLSTQKPTAEALSTSIRDQMGLRIALGNMSKPGYKMSLGDDWIELPKFDKGIGKGLIMIEGNGWNTPKGFEAPNLELENFSYHRTLADLLDANEIKYMNY